MHAKRSSSNNLHHRENADRGHQAETQKRPWQPRLTAQSLRSNCVHNLGASEETPRSSGQIRVKQVLTATHSHNGITVKRPILRLHRISLPCFPISECSSSAGASDFDFAAEARHRVIVEKASTHRHIFSVSTD